LTDHNWLRRLQRVAKAESHLSVFRSKANSTPPFSSDEASLSANLHTYMRKGMNDPLGTLLYRLIAEDRGKPVWYAFIKGIANSHNSSAYKDGIKAAQEECLMGNYGTDSVLMLSALELWETDFENAWDWARNINKYEP
jgi:hypothetical protein